MEDDYHVFDPTTGEGAMKCSPTCDLHAIGPGRWQCSCLKLECAGDDLFVQDFACTGEEDCPCSTHDFADVGVKVRQILADGVAADTLPGNACSAGTALRCGCESVAPVCDFCGAALNDYGYCPGCRRKPTFCDCGLSFGERAKLVQIDYHALRRLHRSTE